ncbi:hypothetical protein IM40_02980 [Candidatus Paracaedimonas acanthamoebae]|nr:hypothetical protein IM40_02980 [Candidatus Paracaedimonas acanthamoebae]
MKLVNIHETKTHLSHLLEEVAQGEDIIICKAGHPIARLVAYQNLPKERIPGYWQGKVEIAEDFDVLPSSVLAAFKGKSE